MDDGHAYATLARGASHRGDGSAVPRTFQVVSDRRGRSSVDGAALCGAQCAARESCRSVPRTGDGPAFGAASGATRQSWTRDRCLCRETGGSTSSPWRRRRSWRRCGVRWYAEHRLARRPGKSARRSVWAWSPRYVPAVGRENLRHPQSRFKTPDPFSLPAIIPCFSIMISRTCPFLTPGLAGASQAHDPSEQPYPSTLGFASVVSDHLLLTQYREGLLQVYWADAAKGTVVPIHDAPFPRWQRSSCWPRATFLTRRFTFTTNCRSSALVPATYGQPSRGRHGTACFWECFAQGLRRRRALGAPGKQGSPAKT